MNQFFSEIFHLMRLRLPATIILAVSLSIYCSFTRAAESENNTDWFFDDSDIKSLEVNEGELTFLSKAPDVTPLHVQKNIKLNDRSLTTGWATFSQCYKNLDEISVTEVVYRYKSLKNLRVLSKQKIQKALVKGQVVRLEKVSKGASLCVSAEAQLLTQVGETIYELVEGPFHRRFLDGYYPFHLELSVEIPPNLKLKQYLPPQQAGFNLIKKQNKVFINTIFEGKLKVALQFSRD